MTLINNWTKSSTNKVFMKVKGKEIIQTLTVPWLFTLSFNKVIQRLVLYYAKAHKYDFKLPRNIDPTTSTNIWTLETENSFSVDTSVDNNVQCTSLSLFVVNWLTWLPNTLHVYLLRKKYKAVQQVVPRYWDGI